MTTEASNVTAGRPKATAEPSPRRGDREQSGIAAVAFDSLLDSTRTLVRAETHHAQRVSPAQMFEPPVADGRDPRKASLHEAQRSDRADARREVEMAPTGVEARRSAQNQTRNGPAPVPTSNESPVIRAPREEAASVRLSIPRSDARPASPSQTPYDPSAESSAISRTKIDRSSMENNVAPAQQGPPGLSVTGATAAEAAAASAPNVARQVGELLGATRGGVELGQGVSSTSAVGDGRSNAISPKTTAPAADRTPQSQGSARPPDETTTQEASPFERLVRSIRLQTGLRSSSARLQLHPPELGRLRVDVRLAGDQVEIKVRTETDTARELVSRRTDDLKTALERHGIQVNRLEVTVRLVPEQPAGTASYDGSVVQPDSQRNSSWAGGRRRSGEEGTDDAGVTATVGDASVTAAVAEARLDIRV